MATLAELRTGRRHVWTLRDDKGTAPFHITKIDGDTVTVEYVHTGDTDTISGVVDHTIRKTVNSHDLAAPGELMASPDGTKWSLDAKERDLFGWAERTGVLPSGSKRQAFNRGAILFGSFDEMVAWARTHRGTPPEWGPDRFNAWVPGDSWRATANGVPCVGGGFMKPCIRIAVADGVCNVHAAHQRRRDEKQAERNARNEERAAESRRRAETRRSVDDTIERLRPLLESLDVRPELMMRGTADDNVARIGVLLDAESMAAIVELAVEAAELREFG